MPKANVARIEILRLGDSLYSDGRRPAAKSTALDSAIAMTALMALGQSTFAAGDHAKGKVAFAAKCGICHETGLGANPFVGPELNGIWGRLAASVPNHTKYSDGLKKLRETGDKLIADPT